MAEDELEVVRLRADIFASESLVRALCTRTRPWHHRIEALKRAHSFCAQQKKAMIVESFDNKLEINTSSSSLVFKMRERG